MEHLWSRAVATGGSSQIGGFPGLSVMQPSGGAMLRELHELGPIVSAGLTLWPLDCAPEALRGWRDHVAAAVASYVNPRSSADRFRGRSGPIGTEA
jgi:hypothetical protein